MLSVEVALLRGWREGERPRCVAQLSRWEQHVRATRHRQRLAPNEGTPTCNCRTSRKGLCDACIRAEEGLDRRAVRMGGPAKTRSNPRLTPRMIRVNQTLSELVRVPKHPEGRAALELPRPTPAAFVAQHGTWSMRAFRESLEGALSSVTASPKPVDWDAVPALARRFQRAAPLRAGELRSEDE